MLVCRVPETVIAYLLYTQHGISSSTALAVALSWNGACVLLSVLLDRHHRKDFAAVHAAQKVKNLKGQ